MSFRLRNWLYRLINGSDPNRHALAPRDGASYRRGPSVVFIWAFAITIILGLAVRISIVVYLNPWGNYGPSGYWRLYNARRAKAEYLESLPRDQLPQVVVLGSSNAMRFHPQTIQRLWNKSAFNYGVFWGRSDDFLCITRFLIHDLDHRPELLLVGIDTWTFLVDDVTHPVFPGVRRRLLNTSQLVKHHPEVNFVALQWSRLIDTLSPQQLQHGLGQWRRGVKRRKQASLIGSNTFDADGTRIKYGSVYGKWRSANVFDDVEAGIYPIGQRIREAEDEELRGILDMYHFSEFNSNRIQQIRLLLEECQASDIRVIFILNPVHPELEKILAKTPDHARNLKRLRAMMKTFEQEHPCVLGTVDASTLDRFGGDPRGFYDAIHPATVNCDKILESVSRQIELP